MISDILMICALCIILMTISTELKLAGFTVEQAIFISITTVVSYEIWKGCVERISNSLTKGKKND